MVLLKISLNDFEYTFLYGQALEKQGKDEREKKQAVSQSIWPRDAPSFRRDLQSDQALGQDP
jgi:hypothetical protein